MQRKFLKQFDSCFAGPSVNQLGFINERKELGVQKPAVLRPSLKAWNSSSCPARSTLTSAHSGAATSLLVAFPFLPLKPEVPEVSGRGNTASVLCATLPWGGLSRHSPFPGRLAEGTRATATFPESLGLEVSGWGWGGVATISSLPRGAVR